MICLDLCFYHPLGTPLSGFIYATRLRFYKRPSRIRIRIFLLLLQVIFESLYLSTSLMGRTRYTNLWVPKGHIHVSSPRYSIRVADSGWVSKLQLQLLLIFDFFNLRLLQSFNFFNLRLLQSSISSIFDFFNFRFHQTSTSWKLSFLQFSTSILRLPEIFGFLNPLSRWEWNVEFIF
jgi:hypothetical protein